MDKKIRKLLVCSLVPDGAATLWYQCGILLFNHILWGTNITDSTLLGTTIVGGVNVAATYIALLLMEITNRRTLINTLVCRRNVRIVSYARDMPAWILEQDGISLLCDFVCVLGQCKYNWSLWCFVWISHLSLYFVSFLNFDRPCLIGPGPLPSTTVLIFPRLSK